MRNVFLPVALIAAVGFGGVAFAAGATSESTGAVLLNDNDYSLVLASGERFVVPSTVDISGYTYGEQINVSWTQSGNSKIVTGVSRAQ